MVLQYVFNEIFSFQVIYVSIFINKMHNRILKSVAVTIEDVY